MFSPQHLSALRESFEGRLCWSVFVRACVRTYVRVLGNYVNSRPPADQQQTKAHKGQGPTVTFNSVPQTVHSM